MTWPSDKAEKNQHDDSDSESEEETQSQRQIRFLERLPRKVGRVGIAMIHCLFIYLFIFTARTSALYIRTNQAITNWNRMLRFTPIS